MKTALSALCMVLAGCSTDPSAGMVAARECGVAKYVAYEIKGRASSAAVIPDFDGRRWWVYSEDMRGALPQFFMSDESRAAMICGFVPEARNARWEPVRDEPATARMTFGCLPRAYATVLRHGGRIVYEPGHYYATR